MMAGLTHKGQCFRQAGIWPALASFVVLFLLAAQLVPSTLPPALPATAANGRDVDPVSESEEEESSEGETECLAASRQQAQPHSSDSRRAGRRSRVQLSTQLQTEIQASWVRYRLLANSFSAGLRPSEGQLASRRC